MKPWWSHPRVQRIKAAEPVELRFKGCHPGPYARKLNVERIRKLKEKMTINI